MSFTIRVTAWMLVVTLLSTSFVRATGFEVRPSQEVSFSDDAGVQVRAFVSSRGAVIEWRSLLETTTLGFNVFRVRHGDKVQLNPDLIAGAIFIARVRTQTYSWFDPGGTADSEYVVEAIDLKGDAVAKSTVEPIWQTSLPPARSAALLSHLGTDGPTQITTPDVSGTKDSVRFATAAGAGPAGALDNQWTIANQAALKIGVRVDGWYRITQPQMAAAGFDTTGDARNLRLFVGGNEIAVSVSRENGPLTSSDYVEFWGQALDLPTTDTQVYWLVKGIQPGLRIATKGELSIDRRPPPIVTSPATAPTATRAIPYISWNSPFGEPLTTKPKESRESLTPVIERAPSFAPAFNAPTKIETPAAEMTSPTPASADIVTPSAAPTANSQGAVLRKPRRSARPTMLRSGKFRRRRNAPRARRRRNHAPATEAPAFVYSVQRRDRNIYYSAALNGPKENFFGPVIFGDGPIVTVNARNLETSSSSPAQIQVAMQGVSLEPHLVRVFVNGSLAGSLSFSDQTAANQTFSVPLSWLIEGDNSIKLAPVASSHDTSILEYVRITYPHSFRPENDSLQFSIKSNQSARLDGFTTSNLRVLDISDPAAVQEIDPIIDAGGNGFAATIPGGGTGKSRRLIALPASRLTQPAWLSINQPSTWNRNTNGASLIILTYKDFIPALAPLVAQRQSQGYSVAVVNVEDVFDEFGYGVHTPQAIRDFLLLARNTWTLAPNYLLLVGDASYDPRNFLGAGNFDFVPSKQIETGTASTATALETASDDWLSDFNDDGIADISTGRLPVRTPAEATLLISKVVNYSPGSAVQSAMLVADTQGSYYFNFEAASDQVIPTLPATMAIAKVYRRLQPSDADARAAIVAKLNSGQALTVYSGHGNVNIWGGSIFTSTDAAALTNGNRLPFVVVMDCLNGFFTDPSLQSLSEAMLLAPNGGAVATFASSGLTLPDGQHAMGLRMFQLLYTGAPMALGDASRQAKTATNDPDVQKTWILLGDPTMKIR